MLALSYPIGTFRQPDAAEMDRYKQNYANWLLKVEKFLSSIHEVLQEDVALISIDLAVENTGSQTRSSGQDYPNRRWGRFICS